MSDVTGTTENATARLTSLRALRDELLSRESLSDEDVAALRVLLSRIDAALSASASLRAHLALLDDALEAVT